MNDSLKREEEKREDIKIRVARLGSMLKKYEEILKDKPMPEETREDRFYDYLNN